MAVTLSYGYYSGCNAYPYTFEDAYPYYGYSSGYSAYPYAYGAVNGYCAKQARERGKEMERLPSETFRRNPVRKQAHPVEPGQRPEASLASCPGNGHDEA